MGRRGMGRIVRSAFAAALAEREASPGYYLILGRQAMACQFQIFLRPQDGSFVPAVHEALNEMDILEGQMTAYRDDSEICLLNRTAFACQVPVEERLYGLLCLAYEIGRQTQGAFDITAGPLIRCWGFLERNGRIPTEEELESARAVTGWDKVLFNDGSHSLRFVRSGVELNLGSIGKGYALDRAAELLRSAGLHDFMIHAGHSSIYASGNSNLGSGWEVSIRDPHAPGGSLGTIRLVDQGMSTSGTGQQYFVVDGRRFGHLLDPRTGWPSTHNSLCSVTAPGAAEAEALSTAFFVMTPEAVRGYCDLHPEVGSILVAAQENAEPATLGISLKRPEVRS
ncbi:MAG: FAD:protein FMN transferase [Acidobacteria bacterium]|nr:MAG: FAD:protein FMN transferase [Acidobacteriota bacterium]